MTSEEYIKENYNEVNTLTAVCKTKSCWPHHEYPELEIGKTYHVTHIGVLRSSSHIMLAEFCRKEFEASCFELFEDGRSIGYYFVYDNRFMAPYLRKMRLKDYPNFLEFETENYAIPAHLRHIAEVNDVKILLAVESGSRSWGFESKNSDWDVRFIYVHKPEWYFKIEGQRDVIELVTGDNVDLAGWELRKALSQLKRSNPSILEWLNSPKIYYLDEEFGKRIHEVAKDYYNPVKSMYHYNHMYNKHNERYLQQEGYPMKRFLYYLRGVLACKWIESHQSLPPVPFKELVDATVDDNEIKMLIDELISIKRGEKECDMLVVDEKLVQYARYWADYYNERVSTFRPEQNEASTKALDAILFDMVQLHK